MRKKLAVESNARSGPESIRNVEGEQTQRKLWSILLALALVFGMSAFFAIPVSAAANYAPGAVYAMTNAAAGNQVVAFTRGPDCGLTWAQTVSTGGKGTGPIGSPIDPLASQGSLTLTDGGQWLLACNAGSNSITVFRAGPQGLNVVDIVSSGGTMPVSVTVHGGLVYVLNAGTPNIAGFTLNDEGKLAPIALSTRVLGAGAYAQVGFDNTGKWLAATDKAGRRILVFMVDSSGKPSASPVISPSHGLTPFGFLFDGTDALLVVEVNGGNGAVSSYRVESNGMLDGISPSVASGQNAACWIAGNARGNVFTANPGSTTISAYRDRTGTVSLQKAAAASGLHSIDIGISDNGRFLYGLDPVVGGIAAFQVQPDGSIVSMGTTTAAGLGLAAQGIAVR